MLYCIVMHATDSDVVFVKDKIVGTLSAAVFVDSNLNRAVLNYKPLHIHKLLHSSGKTCSSSAMTAPGVHQPKEITTTDFMRSDTREEKK